MSEPARWSQEQLDAHMARMTGKPAADPPLREKHVKSILPKARKINATESAYAAILEQRKRDRIISDYKREGMTLLLANDTRYIPDFVVSHKERGDGILFVEVKAERKLKGKQRTHRPHFEDDARAKLPIAAEQFKHFATFWLAWLDCDGEWHEEQVNL